MATPENDSIVLQTIALSKHYSDGEVQALKEVSVAIRRGEFVTIMGHSGSGKSTLLSLLGGLDVPTHGVVHFQGLPLARYGSLDRFRAFKIGFVFQSFLLLPTLTALENVQVPMFEGRLKARQRADRARELLNIVGLSHRIDHLPSQLSVGERQRVAVARSLANDPLILLADEPTGNLDTKNATGILDLFAKLNREHGLTIVVVTHWDKVASYGTRVIYLDDGRVISDDLVQTEDPAPQAAAAQHVID